MIAGLLNSFIAELRKRNSGEIALAELCLYYQFCKILAAHLVKTVQYVISLKGVSVTQGEPDSDAGREYQWPPGTPFKFLDVPFLKVEIFMHKQTKINKIHDSFTSKDGG